MFTVHFYDTFSEEDYEEGKFKTFEEAKQAIEQSKTSRMSFRYILDTFGQKVYSTN